MASLIMVYVSASLLAADAARLGEEVLRAEMAGVDSFHLDIMDAHYVPNLALTPHHLHALRPYTSLPLHLHLEVDCPQLILDSFDLREAATVFIQADTLDPAGNILHQLKSLGIEAGLSLNPGEELDRALPWFPILDSLLILGVNPGFGGQALFPGTLQKVSSARELIKKSSLPIVLAVDGGVTVENAQSLISAGADCLIAGTALFKASSMIEVIRSVKGYAGRLDSH